MFSQRESRDELGLGQIRAALSDTLFPGTSVQLTRARYFLFVPWLYREGARRGYHGLQLASWVEQQERRLIRTLQAGDDQEGLIGRVVGAAVQTLPSSIYWNSLRSFGILRYEGTAAQIVGLPRVARPLDGVTEFLERSEGVWVPSLPEPPTGFFKMTSCDLALTHDEATWFAERIVDATPNTLLEFLITRGNHRSANTRFVWEDPDTDATTGRVRDTLHQARNFAIAMHGAALLYNVLLAKRSKELGLMEYASRRDHFVARLNDWYREVDSIDLSKWDLDQLWALVAEQGRPVASRTRIFVTDWVNLMRRRRASDLVENSEALALVRNRELFQKGNQARLRNDRLMRQWSGASGSERLDFRWPVVARLLDDIAKGRGTGHARP